MISVGAMCNRVSLPVAARLPQMERPEDAIGEKTAIRLATGLFDDQTEEQVVDVGEFDLRTRPKLQWRDHRAPQQFLRPVRRVVEDHAEVEVCDPGGVRQQVLQLDVAPRSGSILPVETNRVARLELARLLEQQNSRRSELF